MAFDFFPKTKEELSTATKKYNPTVREELLRIFVYLKKKYPKLETPINMDLTKKTSLNISRILQEEIKIETIKRQNNIKKISMKYGNGSSGNRGVNNRGNLFEPLFAKSLLDWWSGKKISNQNILKAIEHINTTYDMKKSKSFRVDVVGGKNTKRPVVFSPEILISNPNPSGGDFNVGESVTDITITLDKKVIYLSLKMGNTVTFFNVGVRTVLTPEEIKKGSIKNSEGKKLLKLFGINEKLFCDVFNGKLKRGVVQRGRVDSNKMKKLLQSGIGYGYHIIHKLGSTIKSKEMNESMMKKSANVGQCTIYYGGKTGVGKRIDMEMSSGIYSFKLNIRDTQGKDGYPTRLMCDFTYK